MQFTIIWVNVKDDKEADVARLMNGLNHDITHIMIASLYGVGWDDAYGRAGGETF
jgi:hypothetical protein